MTPEERRPMAEEKASRPHIAALVKWAGMTIPAKQFDQLCEAYVHVERMLDRLPRDRSRSDEPANHFEFPREEGKS